MLSPDEWVDLPGKPQPPMEAPCDFVTVPDIKWREGLWTVIYHDDGTMSICDWPIPADGLA